MRLYNATRLGNKASDAGLEEGCCDSHAPRRAHLLYLLKLVCNKCTWTDCITVLSSSTINDKYQIAAQARQDPVSHHPNNRSKSASSRAFLSSSSLRMSACRSAIWRTRRAATDSATSPASRKQKADFDADPAAIARADATVSQRRHGGRQRAPCSLVMSADGRVGAVSGKPSDGQWPAAVTPGRLFHLT